MKKRVQCIVLIKSKKVKMKKKKFLFGVLVKRSCKSSVQRAGMGYWYGVSYHVS